MTVPLRPNMNQDSGDYTGLSLESLQSAAFGSNMTIREAGIPDRAADTLFELWEKSSKESQSNADAEYRIPEGFPNDKIMMLKTENLLYGDSSIVKFTSKGKEILRLMILSEENAVKKSSIKKPYSVILAESKMITQKRSRLAFASVDVTGKTASGINLSVMAQSNVSIPPNKMPTSESTYVWSERLKFTEGSSNKQYIVRVYSHPDGTYTVVAFNGRIGQPLKAQPKGMYHSLGSARSVAEGIVATKTNKGYEHASDNMAAPGRPSGASSSQRTPTSTPASRPTTTPPPPSPSREAPKPASEEPKPVKPPSVEITQKNVDNAIEKMKEQFKHEEFTPSSDEGGIFI